MKILVISNLYPPDFLGGYELGCRQAADALRAAGHEVRVLTGAPRSPVPADPRVSRLLRLADVYDQYTQRNSRPLARTTTAADAHTVQAFNVHVLAQIVEEFQPDVAYVWNTIGLGGLGLLAALQQMGVPWLMHLMDRVPVNLCGFDGTAMPGLAEAFLRLCRGRFLCCSQTTLDEIAAFGVPIGERTTLIPNWVTTNGSPHRTEYMPGGVLRIVSAGSISVNKGVDKIIGAAAILRSRGHANFSIDLYGPGTDPVFQTLIQSHRLDDTVRLMGVRPQAELDRLLPHYDVFAFPTWDREPFAFAPMEAAAHGCLQVMSNVNGGAEWFVDKVTCLKVPRTDAGLATALEGILTGTIPLAKIAHRGMQVVLRDFHLSAVLPRIEAELERAVRIGGGPAKSAGETYRLAVMTERMMHCLIQETSAA